LTTAHETGQVLSAVLEKALASLESDGGGSTFRLGKLGDSKESNLHTLKKSNTRHEDDEKDEGDSLRDSRPGGGLSKVEGFDGDSKSEAKNTAREQDSSPEEGEGKSGLGRLVGFQRLSGGVVDDHGDQVRSVDNSGDLNQGSNPVGEDHEVVVDVVKHHV
jgi:hypothetical protein